MGTAHAELGVERSDAEACTGPIAAIASMPTSGLEPSDT